MAETNPAHEELDAMIDENWTRLAWWAAVLGWCIGFVIGALFVLAVT